MSDSSTTTGETISKGIINSNIMYDFSFSSMGQEYEWSCWYACTKIIFQWAKETGIDGYSPDKVDEQLIARAFGTKEDLEQAKINGLDPKKGDFEKLRGAIGFVGIGRSTALGWDGDGLVDFLHQMGPLYWCRKVEQKGGDWTYHAMVIRGFETNGNGTLTVINPFDDAHFTPPISKQGAPFPAIDAKFGFKTFKGLLAPAGSSAEGLALMALGKPQKT
jgi:hypothetical protein